MGVEGRAVTHLAPAVVAPTIGDACRGQPAAVPAAEGAQCREAEAARYRRWRRARRRRAVAQLAVGIRAPAIPVASRRHPAGVEGAGAEPRESRATLDGQWRRAAVQHGIEAGARFRSRGTELAVAVVAPAVGCTARRQAARMPVAHAERGEREPALHGDRRRAARFRAAPFGARGADAELPKRIVSPAVHGAGGGEPAGERNPGADGDEGEVAAHRQGRPRARGRPAAEAAGGIVAPAVGGAARRQGTAQHPACAQRRKRAPAGDGDRCRAAPRSLETAAFRSRRAGAELAVVVQAPAVCGAAHREAAAV